LDFGLRDVGAGAGISERDLDLEADGVVVEIVSPQVERIAVSAAIDRSHLLALVLVKDRFARLRVAQHLGIAGQSEESVVADEAEIPEPLVVLVLLLD